MVGVERDCCCKVPPNKHFNNSSSCRHPEQKKKKKTTTTTPAKKGCFCANRFLITVLAVLESVTSGKEVALRTEGRRGGWQWLWPAPATSSSLSKTHPADAFILIAGVGPGNRLPSWRYSAYYRVHLHCQSHCHRRRRQCGRQRRRSWLSAGIVYFVKDRRHGKTFVRNEF